VGIAEDFPGLPTVPAKTHNATMIGVRTSSSLRIVARRHDRGTFCL
jgi:hypothetical protein